MSDRPDTSDDLCAAGRLFGRLLVRELDAATLTELQAPEIAAALAALGIDLPTEQQRHRQRWKTAVTAGTLPSTYASGAREHRAWPSAASPSNLLANKLRW